jgi:hypothetical protein
MKKMKFVPAPETAKTMALLDLFVAEFQINVQSLLTQFKE